jgi:hypothetical protein
MFFPSRKNNSIFLEGKAGNSGIAGNDKWANWITRLFKCRMMMKKQ